jgi:DNA-binding CsgD family transcriptional regulator
MTGSATYAQDEAMVQTRDEPTAQPLRGRVAEQTVLAKQLEALAGGSAGVVLVVGRAGVGKTALLAESVADAARRRIQVLSGAGDAVGQAVPLGPVLEALVYSEDPPVDPEALQELSRYPDQRFWLLRELQQQLERAALRRPLMIVLDDLQWADAASLTAIATLPRRLSSHSILWLLAARMAARSEPIWATLSRLRENGAALVELGPLEQSAVVEVANDVLHAEPDASIAQVLDGVHGQPFLLTELLRGLRDEGLVEVENGTAHLLGQAIPRRFLESVGLDLERLPREAREAVQMASVLGRRFSAEELGSMLERPPAALMAQLRDAISGGFLIEEGELLGFRHDLVREAVDANLPSAIRGELQRRAIEVRLDHGVPAAEVATLVADAAEPGDTKAIELLRRAAGEVGRVSPIVAAPLSRRALELTPPGQGARGPRVVETLNFLVHAGQAAEADRLMTTNAEDLVDSVAEAEARLHIGLLMMQYEPRASVAQCERALALGGLPGPLRVQLLSLLSRSHELRGDVDAALEPAEQAREQASEALIDQVMSLVPAALIAFADARWSEALAHAEDAVKLQAQAAGTASRLWLSSAWKTLLLVSLAKLDEATALIDAGTQSAQEEGVAANVRIWSMLRCRALLGYGLLADARAEAEAVLEMSDEFGGGNTGYLNDVAGYVLATVALHTGDPDELAAARVIASRLREERTVLTRRLGYWLEARLGELGEPDSRTSALDVRLLDPLSDGHIQASSPRAYDDAVGLVRVLCRSGQAGDAAAVVARLEDVLERSPDFPFLEAVTLRCRALLERDCQLAMRALDLHSEDPRPLVRASALEDAAALLPASRRDESVRLFDEALALYSAAGADRDSARVRARLRERGARRASTGSRSSTDWPGLTNSELAVVRLVARGATNREVAEQLFVSPYTVNSHLRHVFSKLGIRSRVELARLAAERHLDEE